MSVRALDISFELCVCATILTLGDAGY